jgi:hypothetical protein
MSKLAIYRPIMMKIGTRTEKNKSTKPELCGLFCKMATPAILKSNEML